MDGLEKDYVRGEQFKIGWGKKIGWEGVFWTRLSGYDGLSHVNMVDEPRAEEKEQRIQGLWWQRVLKGWRTAGGRVAGGVWVEGVRPQKSAAEGLGGSWGGRSLKGLIAHWKSRPLRFHPLALLGLASARPASTNFCYPLGPRCRASFQFLHPGLFPASEPLHGLFPLPQPSPLP